MGLLPFDDWIYHLPYMRDEVNSKHDLVVKTQDTVQTDVLAFNKQLDKYKLLITNNAVLIYISSAVQMDDLKLAAFTTQIDALPPPVKGDIILNALEGTAELIGGALVLKFVVNLGKLAKDAIFGTSKEVAEGVTEKVVEDLGAEALDSGIANVGESALTESLENVGEDVTEEVVESASSATLAATGIGIFLAVGLDVIFGAINGAQERDQLQKILDQLDAKMKIVNQYLSTVNSKVAEINEDTVGQITTFKKVATDMTKLLPAKLKPTFKTDFPATLASLDTCLADQQLALTQFSLLIQLRDTYVKALKRNPKVTKDTVINSVLLTAPDEITYDILDQIWTQVLAKYSTLMAKAK